MKRTKTKPMSLVAILDAVGDCLTPQAAKRILEIKPNRKVQARVKYLGEQANDGRLTSEEHAEYADIIRYDDMLSILQSKARRLLANPQ
jgi:hypothetical protein